MTPSLRSIRTRWTLALVAVCVVEAVLVAVAVRVSTARAFERFVIEEALVRFVDQVAAQADTRAAGVGTRPPRRPGGSAQGPPPPDREARGPAGRLPPPSDLARGVPFGLADADGRVLRPFDDHVTGDTLLPDVLASGRPVETDGRRIGTAFVPEDAAAHLDPFPTSSPEARFVASSTAALWWALAGALAAAVALASWLSGRTVRPLRDLTAAARRIADGDLRQSVAATTDDEVGTLAAAFNAMSDRLDTATALRRRMTADISHDLRTPLTAVLGTLEAIQTGALPATPERLGTVYAEAQRLGRLIDDLHTLALADADELSVHVGPVDVAAALRHVARGVEAEATAVGIALTVEAEATPLAAADADRLAQILGNLVSNALRFTPVGGTITLGTRAETEGVALSVTDTGTGIPPDVLPVVFERSVRADAARSGEGAGLGLSIVRSLAEAMGGTAAATSPPGEGATVTVTLPRWTEAG